MCTIMTLDRKTYMQNTEAVVECIRDDAALNSDGFSLVLAGATEEAATVLRSMSIEPIVRLLESSRDWKRFWLHCRAATTEAVGLDHCHAFAANGYYVMHNGSLAHPEAYNYPVDSELLASIVARYGVQAGIGYLLEHESFANCFIVNPTSGDWSMVRCLIGTLYTDGKANYSSSKIANLDVIVKPRSTKSYHESVQQRPRPSTVLLDDAQWKEYLNDFAEQSDT